MVLRSRRRELAIEVGGTKYSFHMLLLRLLLLLLLLCRRCSFACTAADVAAVAVVAVLVSGGCHC